MNYQNVFSQIEALADRYLNVWKECCELESPSIDKAAVDRCGQYFIDFAKEHGWKVEVLEQSVSGNAVCITMNPEVNEKPLAVSGHIDTVHPVGLFGDTPVRIEGDTFTAPAYATARAVSLRRCWRWMRWKSVAIRSGLSNCCCKATKKWAAS